MVEPGPGVLFILKQSMFWWHEKFMNICVCITGIETFAIIYILIMFSGELYYQGESFAFINWWCPIMLLWTLVFSIQLSHLPNYSIFACFAWTQTQTIFHITKLLVDWHQNVLADALYLLMNDGCDQFKILNSELQILKPLNKKILNFYLN